MKKEYLVKIGEIALKGGNRKMFERQLRSNILKRFSKKATFTGNQGRYYLRTGEAGDDEIAGVLRTVFGVTGFNPVARVDKNMEEIGSAAVEIAKKIVEDNPSFTTFKIEARRSDKGFHLDSYGICRELGGVVLKNLPGLSVDLKNPDFTIRCEIRERAVIYADSVPGPGGLPVGCAGKGMLLLSGGIDSPVAGYLMAKRGLKLDAVYFHTPPFTSEESLQKVKDLTETIAPYCSGLRLYTVPFTDAQLHMKQHGKDEETTLLMRACMMKIADHLAKRDGAKCLVTGEALSQVASQTVESIRYTGSYPDLPVFRPLIGYDKEEIIDIGKRIGTFPISIRPYDDCCTIFSPARPVVKPDFLRMRDSFEKLDIEPLLDVAAERAELTYFPPGGITYE